MSAFRCINCGAIKENEKKCSCSRCGYTMYEWPYDRHNLLLRECRKFLNVLFTPEISYKDFEYYRTYIDYEDGEKEKIIEKKEDDSRFPSPEKIEKYIRSASRSEKAIENARKSLVSIKKYLSTEYAQKYLTRYDSAYRVINNRESILAKALSAIGIKTEFQQLVLPEFTLFYSEKINRDISICADDLISRLGKLLDKIALFIKENNVYGGFCNEDTKVNNDFDKSLPVDVILRTTILEVEEKLAKKYTVDLLSDGHEYLDDMLNTFFRSINILLNAQILQPEHLYTFSDGELVLGKGFVGKITVPLIDRYFDYRLMSEQILVAEKFSEEELFDIYDKYVKLDSFNVFTARKNFLKKKGESERKLDRLIGLTNIKSSIKKIKAYALANKESDDLNLHMCFYGNPGTGKTEVARLIAGILYENDILETDTVVEVSRCDLISQYLGETAIKTSKVIDSAMGGVLFIDEAYSLLSKDNSHDYGHEAISTLIKAMEDHRGEFCVILAGYRNQMADMISSNPGFKSRIQFELDFPDYSRDELFDIASLMLEKRGYTITAESRNKILDLADFKRKQPNFANAREIRNILDQVIMNQNLRVAGADDKEIGLADVNEYITSSKIKLPLQGKGMSQTIMSADDELDALVGLDSVKRMVKKIRAYAKRNKEDDGFNIHMCFYGNPGTGKTEVARIISRILYDVGILPEAKLIETDAHGLIGKYVGETAPKTEEKIADAMGGILFIDEAYSLVHNASIGGISSTYGEEAIAVLLKKMEDRRGDFAVILAGYKNEMQNMISSNPGLESRIQFTLEFPDYTREELSKIAVIFASKKKYVLEKAALERILDVSEYYRSKPNFANARTIRNILDQVIMNQNLRIDDNDLDDNTIILQDVEDYISDENIM